MVLSINRFFGLSLSIILISCSFCHADTVYLKDGRVIEGEIVEETDDHVKLDCMGLGFYSTYKKKSIKEIVIEVQTEALEPKEENSEDEVNNNSSPQPMEASETTEEKEYILYVPAGLHSGQRYPLVIMLHPAANAKSMITFWRPIADKNKFILYASKIFRNGKGDWLEPEEKRIKKIMQRYPIDRRKVIATGISGGGMGAHHLSYFYPKMITAIITNVGRIQPEFKTNSRSEAEYPRKKLAVFLASPSDFNYKQMTEDKEFLDNLHWKTKWIEFEGGHVMASLPEYQKAVAWIQSLWK